MIRRGSILLEVLLAIAVFAFAGVVVLGAMQETVAAGARAARRALAMDMARSRMAELEAGVGDLPEDASTWGGTDTAGTEDPRRGLRVEVTLERSEIAGLDLAIVEVWDDAAPRPTLFAEATGLGNGGIPPRLAVLRQLVRAGASAVRPAAAGGAR